MKSINQLLEERGVQSPWRGSEKTAAQMREQLREKFNDEVADSYDAAKHVMSLRQWGRYGIKILPGESALHTYTLVEGDTQEEGEYKTVRRSVPVFHYLQTDLISQQ